MQSLLSFLPRPAAGWLAAGAGAGLVALAGVPAASLAAEGMYTFDNLPRAAMQRDLGFAPSAAWAERAMKSSVRLAGGCSGSFVSPDGLVLTNHHCVNACVQELSTPQQDFIRQGFYANTLADEKKCPTIELNRLEAITDVTARIAGATQGLPNDAASAARKAEQAKIEATCAETSPDGKERTRCDVVDLYHGGRYNLYRYHRFQDVRLVFAPELAIAFFGGDPDNFNFPRYDLDMGMLRAYEDGRPARVASYFPFSASGPAADSPTFVAGHPGSTQRQLTVTQLETLRDFILPARVAYGSEFRGLVTEYRSTGPEAARVGQHDLFGVENSLKVFKGQFASLADPAVFTLKRQQEADLKAYVAAHPELSAKVGDPWSEIASLQPKVRAVYWRNRLLEGGVGFNADYFAIARTLVRGAAERPKPNATRLKEFTDSNLPQTTQQLFSTAPITPEFEKVKLSYSLVKLREYLGPDDPLVQRLFRQKSPEQLANEMVRDTQLASLTERHRLWDGGQAAVDASTDPFIVLARTVDPEARAVRKDVEDNLDQPANKAAERIATARFAKEGTGAYPDATFTLRLSYGRVKGWDEYGRTIEPFTTFGGAFLRNTGYDPFRLPDSWLAAKDRLDMSQRFDLVTDNDIIGGNSGSPLFNQNLEIVGLVFDGNIHSLGGAYWYDPRLNRTVAVHSGAILAALRKIYGAGRIADELTAARTGQEPVRGSGR